MQKNAPLPGHFCYPYYLDISSIETIHVKTDYAVSILAASMLLMLIFVQTALEMDNSVCIALFLDFSGSAVFSNSIGRYS